MESSLEASLPGKPLSALQKAFEAKACLVVRHRAVLNNVRICFRGKKTRKTAYRLSNRLSLRKSASSQPFLESLQFMSAVTWQGETHVRFGSATALTAKCFSGFSEERPDLLDVTNSKHCCLLPFDLAVLKQWFCCNACRFWTLTCPFSITWQLLAKTVGRSMRPVGSA